ncbi:hypothetical protein [Sagittula salina]|uniref:Lipoprotein n=1 Tax=Sagittula salina TaxID=2820268 RepID=A0A940MLC8_9RHOB|nr:hypothetical protein [Sagittula salina]MBP0483626.1 hypothetical protein [Sagittula salina]
MRKLVAVALTIGAVSGCVNQETFVKNNIRYSEYELDRAECETKAAQDVAVNRSPGAEIAVAILTGVYQTQDANADARRRNYEACMIKKGYQRVELPMCPNAQKAKANGVGPLNAHEKISVGQGSCVASDSSGRVIFSKKE